MYKLVHTPKHTPSLWKLTVFKDYFFVFFFFFLIFASNEIFNRSKLDVKLTINPFILFQACSMLGNVSEIYELSTARLPTEPYDRTILSLLVWCLFMGRGKH